MPNRKISGRNACRRAGACSLAGVDVQSDRLEMELVAWGKDAESWSIHFFVLYGNTSEPEVWNRLDELLSRSWPHVIGHAHADSSLLRRFRVLRLPRSAFHAWQAWLPGSIRPKD